MSRWEYQFVLCDMHDGIWYPRYVNGSELSNWEQGAVIYDYANHLGEEGWELVSVTCEPSRIGSPLYRLVFKRPKTHE